MSCASNIIDVQTPSNSPGQSLNIPALGTGGPFILVEDFDSNTTYEIELIITNTGTVATDFASGTVRIIARDGVIVDGILTTITNGNSDIGINSVGVSGGDYVVQLDNTGTVDGDFSIFTRIIEVV